MDFVLDCSVACSFIFEDENNPYADLVLDLLKDQKAIVPSIFFLEITNVLYVAKKKQRCSEAQIMHLINLLNKLSINVHQLDNFMQMQEILSISVKYNLSAYDSSYLYVAKRFSLPLATLDQSLINAANAEGLFLDIT